MIVKGLLLALGASFNPSMLGIVLYLISRPRARALLIAYLVATLGVSMALGILVVEGVASSVDLSNLKIQIGPKIDLGVGILLCTVSAVALLTRWPHREHPGRKHGRHIRVASVPGAAVLGFAHGVPAAYYLVALKDLAEDHPSLPVVIVDLAVFNAVMYSWTIAAVVTFFVRRDWAEARLHEIQGWLSRHGRTLVGGAAGLAGVGLIVLGALHL